MSEQRQRFEAWLVSGERRVEMALGRWTYSEYYHQLAWEAWQAALEQQQVNLEWKHNERDGELHTEWTAPCGCAYHPDPFPHVHPCSEGHRRRDLEQQQMPEWPPADVSVRSQGWLYDYDWMQAIQHTAEDICSEQLALEQVEAVLQAASIVGLSAAPEPGGTND